jgi:DNA polymerase-3 subunit gamma/tau
VTEFLCGAIALLTEADGKIKQSSNQRLLVELGLMKIAGLGKKKSDDDTLTEEYELPTLPDKITPVGAEVSQPRKVEVAQPTTERATIERATAEEASAAKALAEESVTGARAVAEAERAPMSEVAETAQSVVVREVAEAEKPQAEESKADGQSVPRGRDTSLSQFSLRSLMEAANVDPEKKKSKRVELPTVDEHCEEKLKAAREEIIAAILHWRPRFVEFRYMTIEGNSLTVKVATSVLYEEIMRNRTELLILVARTAGVKGLIELNVVVDEEVKAARPIKLEDRVQFLVEKNAKLMDLKAALDLEYD